jgi:hypothetical protein
MPLYQHIVVALPSLSKAGLVDIFKRYSNTVLSSGGVVRGIEHHGIRPLAERARRFVPSFSPSSLPSLLRLFVLYYLSLLPLLATFACCDSLSVLPHSFNRYADC